MTEKKIKKCLFSRMCIYNQNCVRLYLVLNHIEKKGGILSFRNIFGTRYDLR